MWLSVLVSSFGNDTNGLSLSVWKFTFVIEDDMANLTSVWPGQGGVKDNLTSQWLLWFVSVAWNITFLIDVINLRSCSWSVLKERINSVL